MLLAKWEWLKISSSSKLNVVQISATQSFSCMHEFMYPGTCSTLHLILFLFLMEICFELRLPMEKYTFNKLPYTTRFHQTKLDPFCRGVTANQTMGYVFLSSQIFLNIHVNMPVRCYEKVINIYWLACSNFKNMIYYTKYVFYNCIFYCSW